MGQDLNVSSWVIIRRGCPITCRVNGDDVEFQLGSAADGFEFVFDVDALRDFVRVARTAIGGRE